MSILNPLLLEDLISNGTEQVHGRKIKWLKTQLNTLFNTENSWKLPGLVAKMVLIVIIGIVVPKIALALPPTTQIVDPTRASKEAEEALYFFLSISSSWK